MQRNVPIPHRNRLSAAPKEKMTEIIYREVGIIYGNINAVERSQSFLCEILKPDHPLRKEGEEVQFLETLEHRNTTFLKAIEELGNSMDKYTMTINQFDTFSEPETRKIIATIQKNMPGKIVAPGKLANLVLKKLEATSGTLTEVSRVKVDTKKNVKNKQK